MRCREDPLREKWGDFSGIGVRNLTNTEGDCVILSLKQDLDGPKLFPYFWASQDGS